MKIETKERIRQIIRKSPIYHKTEKILLSPFDKDRLQESVEKAIQNVPYYKAYKAYLKRPFSIESFPILHKKDIVGYEKYFISKYSFRPFLSRKETGGSTGCSLELFYSPDLIVKKNVIADYAFSLIGENMVIGVLRGQSPKNGKIWQKINSKYILLSSYSLSDRNIDNYLKVLQEEHINCLHVYPSSLFIFAKLIKNKYGKVDLPNLKGILSSSEIFSPENKCLIQEVFPNVKIIDLYGQNEQVCAAIAEDRGCYHFFKNYGYVEFVNTGEMINGHHIAEIVATSIMNTTMPFIRYATEDYVELDEVGNVVSIIGRESDFIVNNDNILTPCIVVTRTCSMKNVTNFQYYQDTEGELVFKVVVNQDFEKKDIQYLLEDMNTSFNGKMNCKVEIVKTIERTKIGKQKRLIQKLNLNKYK